MPKFRKPRPDSKSTPNAWHTTPLRTRVIFLLAVFSTFVGIGVATDVSNLGHDSVARFAVNVLLTAVFAVFYATAGVLLRSKFLRAIVPIFVLQFVCIVLFRHWLPDRPGGVQVMASEAVNRFVFDGVAIIVSVALGYAGLVHVSIRESKRYIKTEIEKARLENEMAAAREAQRVMVPEALPPVAGYSIESVYRPAAEVGGDFFQVIRLNSGRSLAVIGDVSGKGLSAAMIVSMIVGMLAIVCAFTEEPGEILAELNRRLYGRAQGGFATCLIVRLDAGGKLVLATAGHPAPYLNGGEILLAGSMPLGMSDAESFAESSVDMRLSDRVVLLTDGVPEARDEQGVLFGFSRVEALLRDGASARDLADAAQQHGQDDDITVIGIARAA